MKLFEIRKMLKNDFISNGIDKTDVDYILSEVLNVSCTELALIDEITDAQFLKIKKFANMRKSGKPVDKIFKKSYFYGLKFKVNENVLSPRSDSEILVERALKIISANNLKTMLDLCTGSGCIAIALKKNANIEVTASDISIKALNIAKYNAKMNGVKINFIRSDMFEKIFDKYDLIVSNPPYISSDDIEDLDVEVKDHDPRLALDGGDFGLKFYNIIHDNAKKYLNPNGYLILEIGDEQKLLVSSLFADFNLIECVKDYGGNDRVLVFKKDDINV